MLQNFLRRVIKALKGTFEPFRRVISRNRFLFCGIKGMISSQTCHSVLKLYSHRCLLLTSSGKSWMLGVMTRTTRRLRVGPESQSGRPKFTQEAGERFKKSGVIPIWFSDAPPGIFDECTRVGGMTFDVTRDPAPQIASICEALTRKLRTAIKSRATVRGDAGTNSCTKPVSRQPNLCKMLILNICRCGEMADATDLKSVGQ